MKFQANKSGVLSSPAGIGYAVLVFCSLYKTAGYGKIGAGSSVCKKEKGRYHYEEID